MATLAHSPTNDHRAKDFMAEVRELARDKSAGEDSLPKLAIKFADAVHNGTFDMNKDTETGKTIVHTIYETYGESRAKKAVHDHSAGSLKAQISKLTQIGLAAAKTTCDFPVTLGKVFAVHQEMQAKAKETGIKPRSPYAAYVEAARTQTQQDDDLTDDQIKLICRKPDPKDKTELGEVERAEKILDGLVSGESGLGPCQTPEVIAAFEAVRSARQTLEMMAEKAETIAKAVALGLIPDPDAVPPAALETQEAA
jgi:hypothetical protein